MSNEKIIKSKEDFKKIISWSYNHEKLSINVSKYVFKIEVNLLECIRDNIDVGLTTDHIFGLSFYECVFEEAFIFDWTIFGVASFNKTIFKKNANFSRTVFKSDSTFVDSVFEQGVSFDNTCFESKIRFYRTKFKGVADFNNTKFKNLADFWSAIFYSTTIFYKTDFLGTTVFSTTTFNENVLFTYTLIKELIILRDTKFEKGLDLSLAIISGKTNIFNIKLHDYQDVSDTNDIEEFEDNVSEKGVITRKNKRETFRIIKNQLMLNQNNIDAIYFYSIEMKSYAKQLHQEIFNEKIFKNILDYFVLKLNWLSNKNGVSWGRGIIFTFLAGCLFLYLSIISTECYFIDFRIINSVDFLKCFKYFFIFILPTHNANFLDAENPTKLFYLFDFLGRIFVSYGIYQTIQAFRKYKSK